MYRFGPSSFFIPTSRHPSLPEHALSPRSPGRSTNSKPSILVGWSVQASWSPRLSGSSVWSIRPRVLKLTEGKMGYTQGTITLPVTTVLIAVETISESEKESGYCRRNCHHRDDRRAKSSKVCTPLSLVLMLSAAAILRGARQGAQRQIKLQSRVTTINISPR